MSQTSVVWKVATRLTGAVAKTKAQVPLLQSLVSDVPHCTKLQPGPGGGLVKEQSLIQVLGHSAVESRGAYLDVVCTFELLF